MEPYVDGDERQGETTFVYNPAMHVKQGSGQSNTENDDIACLSVNFFPGSVTQFDLEKMFADFGKVKKVNVIRNRETKACQGHAFIIFEEFAASSRAYSHFTKLAVSRPLCNSVKVQYSKRALDKQQSSTLVFENLPEGFSMQDLEKMLQPWEPLLEIQISVKANKAFAQLDSPEKARQALKSLKQAPSAEDPPCAMSIRIKADIIEEKRKEKSWRPDMTAPPPSLQERRLQYMMRQWDKAEVKSRYATLDQIFTSLQNRQPADLF